MLRDHQGQSMLHVLNKQNGETVWEVKRDEPTSWSTPAVIEYNGAIQIITNATNRIRSYDLKTGKVIWESTGMTRNVIPSPLYARGTVYLMSGFRGYALQAISLLRASGDISGTNAILWTYDKNTPYTPNPILMDGLLYFLKTNNGYLSCLDAKDGTEYYSNVKVEGIKNIFTSPVGIDDRIYIAGTNGVCCVVKTGKTYELLAQNTLDDQFFASPVILGDQLYLRGVNALYCIAKD